MRSEKPSEKSSNDSRATKLLFIEHLAQGLQAMELGKLQMNATAYRLYARRLREATAGFPEAKLAARLARSLPAVADALAMRFFDTHGILPGPEGEAVRRVAQEALLRLRVRVV